MTVQVATVATWLARHTQEEIAEATGIARKTIADILAKNETFRFPPRPDQFTEIEDDGERLDATARAKLPRVGKFAVPGFRRRTTAPYLRFPDDFAVFQAAAVLN